MDDRPRMNADYQSNIKLNWCGFDDIEKHFLYNIAFVLKYKLTFS